MNHQSGIVCSCGEKPQVYLTEPEQGGIRRYRVCRRCGVRYRSVETVQAIKPVALSGELMASAVPYRFAPVDADGNIPVAAEPVGSVDDDLMALHPIPE